MLKRLLTCLFFLVPCYYAMAQNSVTDAVAIPIDPNGNQDVYKTIRSITVTGNKRTKIYIVQREFAFTAGTTYLIKDLTEKIKLTKEQLINTTLFVDVIINTTEISNEMVDITVEVKERIYFIPVPYFILIDRNYNEWLKTYGGSLSRVNYGIKVSENNLTGRNDKLNVWLIGGYTQQIQFNYSQPYLDKNLKHGMFMGFQYGRNREVNYSTNFDTLQFLKLPGFARTFYSGHLGYSYRKGSKERHSVKLSYTSDRIDSAIGKLNETYFGNGALRGNFTDLSYTFQYFNVDYIKYPLTGWYVDVFAQKRFSKQLSQFTVEGKYLHSWKLPFPSSYFMLQAAATLNLPFKQPYYHSHLLGYGDINMRGMEYLVVDGVAGGVIKGTVRKKIWNFTFKNPFRSKNHDRIPFNFYAKAFGDIGYVYTQNQTNNSRLSNKLLRSGGFGLDIVTIYDLVLKIEFSFNQLGNHGIYYHTGSDF